MEIIRFISWYIYFILFGIIGLPIANYFFKNWKDKGYPFAKVIGVLQTTIPLWLLASLGIIPFNSFTAFLFLLINFGLAIYLISKQKIKVTKYMIFEEIAFLVIMIIWALIRSINPRAEGTEKFMNLAFMNSIDQTSFFPPKDPWYEGGTINYYYIGHYISTFIGKITGLKMSYAYNLSLVTIIAQLFISVLSIVFEFAKKISFEKSAALSTFIATFISFGGNLHYSTEAIGALLSGNASLGQILNGKFDYYFPDATRIIDYTINEFPAYSIVLGDLHPHYISIPFFMLILALTIVSARTKINSKDIYSLKLKLAESDKIIKFSITKKTILNFFISPFLFILYTINSWDFVTGVFLFSSVHIFQSIFENRDKLKKYIFITKDFSRLTSLLGKILIKFLINMIALVPLGLIIILPYILNFNPPVGGIGFVQENGGFSPIKPWLQMWGAQIIISLIFIVLFAFKSFKKNTIKWSSILMICALCLIIGVEFVFLKDIFYGANNSYFRTNTVFKFYYHAWIVWGLAVGYFSYKIIFDMKPKFKVFKFISGSILIIIFMMSFSYIFKAVDDFYNIGPNTIRTLDGEDYIRIQHPEDYKGIMWIRENIEGQPIIAEAVGDAYTYYARISTHTGLQTVIGWPTHEWQWRDDSETPFRRKDDIGTLYTSTDIADKKEIIDKYEIEYIYLGPLEYNTYPDLNTDLFNELGKVLYSTNQTRIYKIQ